MTRSVISVRPAIGEDAPVLADLWVDSLRPRDLAGRVQDCRELVVAAAADAGRRILVAEHDGVVVGAVHLVLSTLSPVNLDRTVVVSALQVADGFRRHGVGTALMDACVTVAEQAGVAQLAVGVQATSRDANRFMARLALTPRATLRVAETSAVRARLGALRPQPVRAGAGASSRVEMVLAARRLRRRAQEV